MTEAVAHKIAQWHHDRALRVKFVDDQNPQAIDASWKSLPERYSWMKEFCRSSMQDISQRHAESIGTCLSKIDCAGVASEIFIRYLDLNCDRRLVTGLQSETWSLDRRTECERDRYDLEIYNRFGHKQGQVFPMASAITAAVCIASRGGQDGAPIEIQVMVKLELSFWSMTDYSKKDPLHSCPTCTVSHWDKPLARVGTRDKEVSRSVISRSWK